MPSCPRTCLYLPVGLGTTVMAVDALMSQNLAVLSWEPLTNIHPPQVCNEYTCPENVQYRYLMIYFNNACLV